MVWIGCKVVEEIICPALVIRNTGWGVWSWATFVDNFVKYSASWWADTVAALLPNGDISMSYFIVNKR